jgi:hypothetical protein
MPPDRHKNVLPGTRAECRSLADRASAAAARLTVCRNADYANPVGTGVPTVALHNQNSKWESNDVRVKKDRSFEKEAFTYPEAAAKRSRAARTGSR